MICLRLSFLVSSKMCSVSMPGRNDQELGKLISMAITMYFNMKFLGVFMLLLETHVSKIAPVVYFLSILWASTLNHSWPLQFCNLYNYKIIQQLHSFLEFIESEKKTSEVSPLIPVYQEWPHSSLREWAGCPWGQGKSCSDEKAF